MAKDMKRTEVVQSSPESSSRLKGKINHMAIGVGSCFSLVA